MTLGDSNRTGSNPMNLIDINPLAVATGTFLYIAFSIGAALFIGRIFRLGEHE